MEDDKWFCPYCGKPAKLVTEEESLCEDEMHHLIKCEACGRAIGLRTGGCINVWLENFEEIIGGN